MTKINITIPCSIGDYVYYNVQGPSNTYRAEVGRIIAINYEYTKDDEETEIGPHDFNCIKLTVQLSCGLVLTGTLNKDVFLYVNQAYDASVKENINQNKMNYIIFNEE